VQARGTPPRVDPLGQLETAQGVELLARPLALAGRLELRLEHVAQLDQHLDVEGGVLQPRLGQWPGRPVDRRVLLLHPEAEQGLDEGRQPDPWIAEQPAGQLGVEQLRGNQADVGEAGEVLGRGMQDPLGPLEHLLQRRQGLERDRVDEVGAAAAAAQLDQVGAVGVPVARGALGVDRDRPLAALDRRTHLGQPGLGVDDRGEPVGEREELGLGFGR
jgi:hypothetical protein